MGKYLVIWGNGNTGKSAGVVEECETRQEAEKASRAFLEAHADNPAVGAWVVLADDDWDC